MKQYRILVKVDSLGGKKYYPQYKNFLFWRYFTQVFDTTFKQHRIGCNTFEKAKNVIDTDIRNISQKRISKAVGQFVIQEDIKYSSGYMGSCGGL